MLVGREGERVGRTRRDQRRSEGMKERIAIVGKVGCNDFIERGSDGMNERESQEGSSGCLCVELYQPVW